jgi:DNA-binding transcriptional LysR family regulator
VILWAATTDLVLDLVLRGAGVAVLPHHVAAPLLGRRQLRVVRTGRPELRDTVWLHAPARGYRDATLEAFRTALVAELGGERP